MVLLTVAGILALPFLSHAIASPGTTYIPDVQIIHQLSSSASPPPKATVTVNQKLIEVHGIEAVDMAELIASLHNLCRSEQGRRYPELCEAVATNKTELADKRKSTSSAKSAKLGHKKTTTTKPGPKKTKTAKHVHKKTKTVTQTATETATKTATETAADGHKKKKAAKENYKKPKKPKKVKHHKTKTITQTTTTSTTTAEHGHKKAKAATHHPKQFTTRIRDRHRPSNLRFRPKNTDPALRMVDTTSTATITITSATPTAPGKLLHWHNKTGPPEPLDAPRRIMPVPLAMSAESAVSSQTPEYFPIWKATKPLPTNLPAAPTWEVMMQKPDERFSELESDSDLDKETELEEDEDKGRGARIKALMQKLKDRKAKQKRPSQTENGFYEYLSEDDSRSEDKDLLEDKPRKAKAQQLKVPTPKEDSDEDQELEDFDTLTEEKLDQDISTDSSKKQVKSSGLKVPTPSAETEELEDIDALAEDEDQDTFTDSSEKKAKSSGLKVPTPSAKTEELDAIMDELLVKLRIFPKKATQPASHLHMRGLAEEVPTEEDPAEEEETKDKTKVESAAEKDETKYPEIKPIVTRLNLTAQPSPTPCLVTVPVYNGLRSPRGVSKVFMSTVTVTRFYNCGKCSATGSIVPVEARGTHMPEVPITDIVTAVEPFTTVVRLCRNSTLSTLRA